MTKLQLLTGRAAIKTYYNSVYQVKINPYIAQPNKAAEKPAVDTQHPEEAKQPKPQSSLKDEQNQSYSNTKSQTAIDYSSNKVNITNILQDFKSTISAIGADEKTEKKVLGYLNLTEMESQESNPSSSIIRNNLKTASKIIDNYITNTLNKDSSVVSTWIEALLSQNVDYKAAFKKKKKGEEDDTNVVSINTKSSEKTELEESTGLTPEIEEKLIDNNSEEDSIQAIGQETKPKKQRKVVSFQAKQIKNLYKKAQKYTTFEEYDKAILTSRKALNLASKSNNSNAKAIIHLGMGNTYEKKNDIINALKNYNQATKSTDNSKVLAEAHYKMAAIYNKAGKKDVAIPHYYKSLGQNGELDNMQKQTSILQNIGDIFVQQGKYKKSLNHYSVSYDLAKQSSDSGNQTVVLNKIGNVFKVVGHDKQALRFYVKASKLGLKTSNPIEYAKSFENMGDILAKNGSRKKAFTLYKEAAKSNSNFRDNSLRIHNKIKLLSYQN